MPLQISDNKTTATGVLPNGVLDLPSGKPSAGAGSGSSPGSLVAEINEAAMKNKEKIQQQAIENENQKVEQREETSRDDPKNRQDNTVLSPRSRLYNIAPEELERMVRLWTLEMEVEVWEALLNWLPSADAPISTELHRLAALYQTLLDAIYSNTDGQMQIIQLQRLEQALSDVLNRFSDSRMEELTAFFQKFGEQDVAVAIKSSLYRAVTGHTLPNKEMEQFWRNKPERAGTGIQHNLKSSYQKAGGSAQSGTVGIDKGTNGGLAGHFREKGVIYQPDGKGKVAVSHQFSARMNEESGRTQTGIGGAAGAASFKTGEQTIADASGRIFTPLDLEKTGAFVRYLEEGGNLFENPQITGESEELMGIMASMMSLKTQIFASGSGISLSMKTSIESAVDKLIDYYLQKAERNTQQAAMGNMVNRQSGNAALSQKEIYRVYYYVMEQYQSTGKSKSSILKGIQYALEVFFEKQQDDAYHEVKRYSRDADFFFGLMDKKEGRDHGPALEKGKRLLERDWEGFVKTMKRKGGRTFTPGLLEQSPWGMLVKPEKNLPRKSFKYMVNLFLAIAAVIIVLMLIFRFA